MALCGEESFVWGHQTWRKSIRCSALDFTNQTWDNHAILRSVPAGQLPTGVRYFDPSSVQSCFFYSKNHLLSFCRWKPQLCLPFKSASTFNTDCFNPTYFPKRPSLDNTLFITVFSYLWPGQPKKNSSVSRDMWQARPAVWHEALQHASLCVMGHWPMVRGSYISLFQWKTPCVHFLFFYMLNFLCSFLWFWSEVILNANTNDKYLQV